MNFTIRPASSADKSAISLFTEDTFTWGDYVSDEIDEWLSDESVTLLIAADETNTAVGLANGTLMSEKELWLRALRVHAGRRREGIATALFRELMQRGHNRGAVIARLAIESWNTPALAQVESMGMRQIGSWVSASRDVVATAPVVKTNGGRRKPPSDRLNAANAQEAQPAFIAWSSGEVGRAARTMLCIGWRWRRMLEHDLVRAARADALWVSPAGWVIVGMDEATLEVGWLETSADRANELIKATIDLAAEFGATRVTIKTPDLPWLRSVYDGLGFTTKEVGIFATSIQEALLE